MWNNAQKYSLRAFNDIKNYLFLNQLIGCWNPYMSSDWSTPLVHQQKGRDIRNEQSLY